MCLLYVEDFPLLLAFFPKIHGKKSTCADKKILRLLLWSDAPPFIRTKIEAKSKCFKKLEVIQVIFLVVDT